MKLIGAGIFIGVVGTIVMDIGNICSVAWA